MRKYFGPVLIVIVALLVIFGSAIVGLYTDWLWFDDLNFSVIFSTILLTRIKIGILFGGLFFLIIYGNLWYARKIAPPPSPTGIEQQLLERLGRLARRGIGLLIFAGSIIIAAMVGLEAATHWDEWLKYFNAVPFEAKDPLFHRDIGFYVFKLPFLGYLYHWLFFALAASAVASAALHYADEAIEFFGERLQFAPKVKAHLSVLVAGMFFLKAWGYRLSMYDLVNVRGDLFDGAGYTQVHASIPALWILMVVAVLGGLLVLMNIGRRGVGLAVAALAGLTGASIVVGSAYPAIVQQFSVKPNEQAKQRPYIQRAIAATQDAYALSQVASREFAADPSLSAQQVGDNNPTIENIRLWDQQHLGQAYNQIQTIQQYYHFQDVDVDRYWLTDKITGRKRYRQVWLAARELDQERLPDKSRTWVNLHLQYTHGYGFVMSPVNEVNPEGMPEFFVKDIPPVASVELPITNSGVYFGETTSNYVFVRTSAPEFDYPAGERHKPTRYTAGSGIGVGSFFRRLLFAIRFSDYSILLNENITDESRILFRREIIDRVRTLFPFLEFDSDPYLVIANGRMHWMCDAYTTSDAYPYSRHTQAGNFDFNYIRNSVKVVVDAYTGRVDAYVVQKPFGDPIIKAYENMFPGAFKPLSAMPKALREHVRYPEDFFRIQTTIYARYHYSKSNPDGFYRNDDLWEIPDKANLTSGEEDVTISEQMEPYYVIMKLPNGKKEEFILMTPYVRAGGRKNMVAWMCAKCDAADYGRIVLYRFPEQTNVYGPQQVAARASQDTQISAQISLWTSRGGGSRVGSGNLLVVPIESSLLYVMPVYIVSTSTQIPELKRVIVSLGDRVAMEPTLNEALAKVIGEPISVSASIGALDDRIKAPKSGKVSAAVASPIPGEKPTDPQVRMLIELAVTHYDAAIRAQRAGDWAAYGREIGALESTLRELKSRTH
jgi:uncharacterized membrane protein (UPF0182 family)